MHSTARDLRANSPKGGDAKPPVYGTKVPTTAGLPARTLTHRGAPLQAPTAGFGRSSQSPVVVILPLLRYLSVPVTI